MNGAYVSSKFDDRRVTWDVAVDELIDGRDDSDTLDDSDPPDRRRWRLVDGLSAVVPLAGAGRWLPP